MATLFHPRPNYMPREADRHMAHRKLSLWSVPIGRVLFSLIFLIAGMNHFTSGSVSYAVSSGIPMADILVPISGLMAIIGGASVLLGFHARVGAILLLLFLVPVTVLMHDFWNVSDPMEAQMQMTNFLKNVALIGGAILIAFYGAGPISLDHRHKHKN